MAEVPSGLTLEQIKIQFPPRLEVFSGESDQDKIEAQVSRNPERKIIYVVPGSTHKINPDPSSIDHQARLKRRPRSA